MIIYKDLNGSYRVTIDGVLSVIPEVLCSLRFRGTKVSLFRHVVNTLIFEAVEVTEILKSDTPGDYYTDVEDFLAVNSGTGKSVVLRSEDGNAAEVDSDGNLHVNFGFENQNANVTEETTSGIISGVHGVSIYCKEGFSGTIGGVQFSEYEVLNFSHSKGGILNGINYTITSGSLRIATIR